MEWTQFVIFCVGVFGLFFWSRSESRADFRLVLSLLSEMKEEMKDFHGKLERQDAELKSYIMHTNEINRGK